MILGVPLGSILAISAFKKCVDTHVDTHVDMNVDMYVDMHVDTHVDTHADTHVIEEVQCMLHAAN